MMIIVLSIRNMACFLLRSEGLFLGAPVLKSRTLAEEFALAKISNEIILVVAYWLFMRSLIMIY